MKEQEKFLKKMANFMRGNSKMMSQMERGKKNLEMGLNMKEILKMGKKTVLEKKYGKMDKFMKGNLLKG